MRAFKHEKFASKRARLRVHGHRNKVVFGRLGKVVKGVTLARDYCERNIYFYPVMHKSVSLIVRQ